MALLAVGEKAPYFEGVNQAGEKISLNDFQGKKLILYFYPKDDTPGCTAEACNLNDNYEMWIGKGYQVVGVSPDSQASHQKFISKYGLKFNLLSDESKTILNAYGAWGEKKNYGKTYMGVIRSTYIIDEEGRIVEVIGTVDTKNHTGQIMKKLNL
jgi:peroxiredoxin Q/BCP